jgi:hypothetical protein
LLGSGSSGDVWRALDVLDAQPVAVKLLRVNTPAQRVRAGRELAALRLLRVPGVSRLLDSGEHDGLFFLVMELIHGAPFPGNNPADHRRWDGIAETVATLLETLARVHAAGVIHRDLKPANVLVDGTGRPTLVDFGIARGPAVGDAVTMEGGLVGTPTYLAPEQLQGGPVDARTDLYAVGVMVYETLAGQPPHVADNLAELLVKKLTRRPPPVQELAPAVPPRVSAVIDRLLARDPAARPRSANEVLAMLRGEGALPPGPVLPRLGVGGALTALLTAARARRPLDVVGPRGSGRTRLLSDVAQTLRAEGREVVLLTPAAGPFATIVPLVGPSEQLMGETLAEVEAHVDGLVAEALRRGVVVLLDDGETADPWSQGALDRQIRTGQVAIHRALASALRNETVSLEPLLQTDLEPLFGGPDRLLHLREDAARVLHARTGGLPAVVEAEVGAWMRAGITRTVGQRMTVERTVLDRLLLAERLVPPGMTLRGEPPALGREGDELLAWFMLGWPHTTRANVRAWTSLPPWRLEALVRELESKGAARTLHDGRAQPLLPAATLERWSPDRRRAAHAAVARVLVPSAHGRLFHAVAAREAELVTTESLALARAALREGRLGEAAAVLEEGLRLVRDEGTSGAIVSAERCAQLEALLLVMLVKVAMAEESPRALDRALYELDRAADRGAVAPIRRLAAAALQTSRGDSAAALDAVRSLPPLADSELEVWRMAIHAMAAARLPLAVHAEVVAHLSEWAEATRITEARAHEAGWLGVLRYRQQRFAEAAGLHAQAAAGKSARVARLSALLNGASALLEAARHEEARARALAGREEAAACRHAHFEARAEWILRCVSYREGEAKAVDWDLLDAAAALDLPYLDGYIALNEAAVAWRVGQSEAARRLALRAEGSARTAKVPSIALLAQALSLAAGEAASDEVVAALSSEARRFPLPRIGLQALALLARAGRPGAGNGAPASSEEPETGRAEILSMAEATRELLGAAEDR